MGIGDPDFISKTQRNHPGFCGGDVDDMMAYVEKVGLGIDGRYNNHVKRETSWFFFLAAGKPGALLPARASCQACCQRTVDSK